MADWEIAGQAAIKAAFLPVPDPCPLVLLSGGQSFTRGCIPDNATTVGANSVKGASVSTRLWSSTDQAAHLSSFCMASYSER